MASWYNNDSYNMATRALANLLPEGDKLASSRFCLILSQTINGTMPTLSAGNKGFSFLFQSSNNFMHFWVSAAVVAGTNPQVCSSKSLSPSVKLALNCSRGKWGTFSHSLLGQDATIQIWPRFWGDYPCNKIVTTGLLYCVTCLLYSSSGLVQITCYALEAL